jgi:hypothetical protein
MDEPHLGGFAVMRAIGDHLGGDPSLYLEEFGSDVEAGDNESSSGEVESDPVPVPRSSARRPGEIQCRSASRSKNSWGEARTMSLVVGGGTAEVDGSLLAVVRSGARDRQPNLALGARISGSDAVGPVRPSWSFESRGMDTSARYIRRGHGVH